MKYRNVKTQAVIETACKISGGNWVEVEEKQPAKATETAEPVKSVSVKKPVKKTPAKKPAAKTATKTTRKKSGE